MRTQEVPVHKGIIDTSKADRLLRLKDVMIRTSLGSSTIYRHMDAGTFPRPRQLGPACVRWLESDIEKWMAGLPTAGAA